MNELARYKLLAEHYESEWGKCATRLNEVAARLAEAERLLRRVVDLPLWDDTVGGGEVGNEIETFLGTADSVTE